MLNQTAWWKYLVILVVVVVGVFYALPNIFGSDPGMQIRGARGLAIESSVLGKVEAALKSENIAYKSIVQDANGVKIRFLDDETQLRAKDLIESEFGNNYATALTLLPGAPAWLTESGALPMYLGLICAEGCIFCCR